MINSIVLAGLDKENVWEGENLKGLLAKGVAIVIVVFVPHRNPLMVFEASQDGLIHMANDASAESVHTQSIPPGTPSDAFETGWAILTKDLHSAKHFQNLDEARTYYADVRDGLTLQQHALILTNLRRLGERSR